MRSENVDFIGLVETLKSSFSPSELSAVAGIDRYDWNFVASAGHSGDILLGTKKDVYDLLLLTMSSFGLAWWYLIELSSLY